MIHQPPHAQRRSQVGRLRAAELFCLPSHQENFGIVVAEALACCLPVAIADPVNIASDMAAAATGLVHADTAAGTTEALRQWLGLPAAELAQMGKRGLQLFQESYDFASVARTLLQVLEAARLAP
jgi:glycosyltransferase involved in cell wall biosynthesis